MNQENLTSGDILFVRTIKRLTCNLKKLHRLYGIVFGIDTKHVRIDDLSFYLNDIVFKYNLITPQKYHEEMTKFMYWDNHKNMFSSYDNFGYKLTDNEIYTMATISFCCKIIGGTVIAKFPGYIRRKQNIKAISKL